MTKHTKSPNDVIVIGAGQNGLTAAAYLARSGSRVTVVEAAPIIGGMLASDSFIGAPGQASIRGGSYDTPVPGQQAALRLLANAGRPSGGFPDTL